MKRTIILACSLLIICNLFSQEKNIKYLDSILDSVIIKADRIIETDPRVFFKNFESFLVGSHGKIKFEKYYNGVNKDSLHQIQSQTKSIVAILIGIAVDKGYIKSDTELVARYYPDYFPKEDTLKSSVKIKDVLTMSAGFEWEEMLPMNDPKNDNMNMFRSDNWLHYTLTRPMAKKPFTEFKYNSGCPMIIAGIIEKATRMSLEDFAKKYLFEPLGITEYRWLKNSKGFCHAGGGLFLKPIDMFKIGELVLNNGKWKKMQIVSANWIERATHPYFPTTVNNNSYGYFWWIKEIKINESKTIKVISAQGAGGQHIYIFPDYDLVVSFTERNYNTPLVGQFIIEDLILKLTK